MKGFLQCCSTLILACSVMTAVLAEAPQRIISGMPSVTEMLFALDLGDRIVGVTSQCDYPPEARDKERVGGFFLNLEKVVSLKPDLIIMIQSAQKRDIRKLKDFGLNVRTVDPVSVEGVVLTLLELGRLTGTEDRAKTVTAQMRGQIASLEAELTGRSTKEVLVVVGFRPLIVVGQGNFINDLLGYARARNVVTQTAAVYPQLSFEKLLELDPEYIIVAETPFSDEIIGQDRRWQALSAVRNDRVLYIDADILSRPGPRVIQAIEKIMDFIHEVET